jgi:hypothetical protein
MFCGLFRLILFAGILPDLSLATGFRPWLDKSPLQGLERFSTISRQPKHKPHLYILE